MARFIQYLWYITQFHQEETKTSPEILSADKDKYGNLQLVSSSLYFRTAYYDHS